MPKVSVVMPVYNGEAYLKDAIQSIICQTFTDWEFIIVNEYGSNERATAILRDFEAQDARIRVIQNQTRLRIAESLNVGLREATGTYIARMDADDIAGKERFARQVEFLDTHPDIDICGLKVDMFGEHTWEWKVYQDPKYLQCATLFYTPFVHPTIMMRSSSLKREELEYDADFFYTEDYEFFERAAGKLQFTNLEYPGAYHYRYVSTNATNVGGSEGIRLQNQVMKRAFKRWGLDFSGDQIRYLSPNSYPHAFDADTAQDDLSQLDLLLKEVFLCDSLREFYGEDTVFQVLHRRWMDAYESYRWQAEVMNDGQVERAIRRGLFFNEHFYTSQNDNDTTAPRVSVVIPTYNSESYIMDTLFSLLAQDFANTEILVVNEATTNDRTVKCIQLFMDPRIQIIQNQTRLGLAESLNVGIRQAKGEYIARADADDVYSVDRFSQQVRFLDEHPEISICGSWQRHFGKRNYIHQPPVTKEEMKASLLFGCEVCHSTVMMRRKDILSLDKLYDSSYLSEDYELWSRAVHTLNFATIPQVLGEYRWNGENITAKKMNLLDIEAQKIVRRNLKQSLGMEIPDEDLILLSGWKNPFMEENQTQDTLRQREAKLLDQIEEKNKKKSSYNQAALKAVLDRRRIWAGIKKESIFAEAEKFTGEKVKHNILKRILKKLFKPFYRPVQQRFENRLISIQETVWRQDGILNDLLHTIQDTDGHLYDYYHAIETRIEQQDKAIAQMKSTLEQIVVLLHARDGELNQICGEVEENICVRIAEAEKFVSQVTDERIWKAEQNINQTTDGRIWKAEQNINQTTDGRIWKAEQNINQTTDGCIWKAEQNINQTTDGRIWKAEQNINQTTDGRIWKAERTIDDSLYTVKNEASGYRDEIHRHVDFAYRDIMVALERQKPFLPETSIKLVTDYPIAYQSLDHLYPHGTIRDNTRYPRFVEKCEELLKHESTISFLDLGCSGGGMVLEAALRGHVSVGLEGSDCSQKEQRAEWRLLGNRLQTCDITKPFRLENIDGDIHQFSIITAWEVMEHIAENDIPQLLANIYDHLAANGYFVASIANWDDIDPISGVNWHVTCHPYEWWKDCFEDAGFSVCSELFAPIDLARGGYNPPHCYEAPYPDIDESRTFHMVVRKK